MPFDQEKLLEEIYMKVAKLDFGKLLILSAGVTDHIHNCWQHHQAQLEVAKEKAKQASKATQPLEQALTSKVTEH